uniref:Beta-ketoacyl synthase-like N-terminal domain-containing protein n=1 Tax=Timema poppense TaxID=170557 RepID=A0A7R9DK91_TIMPO|nr:unnamed protein product [Timema poppensis]
MDCGVVQAVGRVVGAACARPSYSLQSSETSGVEVLTIAYEAIKNGHCDTALVGAVSFALHPEISYQYKSLGVLSKDGCSRSFDDNGMVTERAPVPITAPELKDGGGISSFKNAVYTLP